MRGQGRRHWIVAVDGNVATFSSLVHASNALKSIGIIASPSRLYSEVYDSECGSGNARHTSALARGRWTHTVDTSAEASLACITKTGD